MRALPRGCVAFAAVALLSGCTAMRFAYDNADSFLRWRATSYVDLQGRASEEFDERLHSFLSWHRTNALPQYAKIAEEGAKRLSAGLAPEDLVWGYDAVISQARESLRVGAERLAPMLDRLNAKQVAQIERRFADDNRKFAREFLRGSEGERRERRLKRAVERLEDWVGSLSDAQLERVRHFTARAPLFDDLRDRDRKRLQQEFLALVHGRQAQKRLAAAAEQFDHGRDPAYKAAIEAYRVEYFAMLIEVMRSLTDAQRDKAVARLRGFAEDFSALARAGVREFRPAESRTQ